MSTYGKPILMTGMSSIINKNNYTKFFEFTPKQGETLINNGWKALFDDDGWRLFFYNSGTLTLKRGDDLAIDIFAVGGGGGGALYHNGGGNQNWTHWCGGAGGGGGYTNTVKNQSLEREISYEITIGAGGAAGTIENGSTITVPGSDGGATSFKILNSGTTMISANGGSGGGKSITSGKNFPNGGDGGSGGGAGGLGYGMYGQNSNKRTRLPGNGGTNGQSGGDNGSNAPGDYKEAYGGGGQYNTAGNTGAFGDPDATKYGGGGGGGIGCSKIYTGTYYWAEASYTVSDTTYTGGKAGAGGGGKGAVRGTDATDGTNGRGGGGGGGGGYYISATSKELYSAGNGGTGILIIRNKR